MLSLPIQKMSLQEKLQVVNAIWDSIGDQADSEISPAWHKEELTKRLQMVAENKAEFEDWSDVKKELQGLID